jgi:ribosomal protein S18 acetylase RimI-like enzyme
MSDAEYKQEQIAFDVQSVAFGNPPEQQKRFGYVATDNGKFAGCSSGLAQMNLKEYGKYFYLTDLLVEKEYRKLGVGKQLLELLESKITLLGIEYVWTWTAGYEAPGFYQKQGYEIFTTFENYYPSGHGRIGFIKRL